VRSPRNANPGFRGVSLLALVMLALACGRARVPRESASECESGAFLVLGACVPESVAREYCGPFADARPDGCTARAPCSRGRARDLDSGACVPRRDVRALAQELGLRVAEDEDLVCEEGAVLVAAHVGQTRLACLPASATAGVPRCARGAASDAKGACASFAPLRASDARIDVSRWALLALGPDGGTGASSFCAMLARSSGATLAAEADVTAELGVDLPNNDVSQARSRVRLLTVSAGLAPAPVTVELDRALSTHVEALRRSGSLATEGAVATRVRCRRSSSRPRVEPARDAASVGQ